MLSRNEEQPGTTQGDVKHGAAKKGGGASCILILVGERRRAWHSAEGNSLMIKLHLQYNQMHEQICVDTGTCQAVVHAECDNTGLHSQYSSRLRQEGCEFKVT